MAPDEIHIFELLSYIHIFERDKYELSMFARNVNILNAFKRVSLSEAWKQV